MSWMMQTPEVTSAKVFSGPGADTLHTAATSWDGVANELRSAAQTYEAVLSGLASWDWLGQASAAMTAAATTFIEWLTSTAARVQQTATQIRAAAMAFEQLLATAVSPAMIAANRASLQTLIKTNFFGQNTPLIESTQAVYAEYWAQDAAAMSEYAVTSRAAATLPTFNSPQQNTSPTGQAAQNASVTSAAAHGTGILQTIWEQIWKLLFSTVPQELGLTESPLPVPILPEDFTVLDGILTVNTAIGSTKNLFSIVSSDVGVLDKFGLITEVGAAATPAAATQTVGGELAPVLASLNQTVSRVTSGTAGGVLASTGRAGLLGPMSVPGSWVAPVNSYVHPLSAAGLSTLPAAEEITAPMPGMPGMPAAGTAPGGLMPRYGTRPTIVARPPAGG